MLVHEQDLRQSIEVNVDDSQKEEVSVRSIVRDRAVQSSKVELSGSGRDGCDRVLHALRLGRLSNYNSQSWFDCLSKIMSRWKSRYSRCLCPNAP